MCMGIIVYYNENPEYYSNSQLASQCNVNACRFKRLPGRGRGMEGEREVEVEQEEQEKPVKWESCTQWDRQSKAVYKCLNRTANVDYTLKSDIATINLSISLSFK